MSKPIHDPYPEPQEIAQIIREYSLKIPKDLKEALMITFYVLQNYYTFNEKKMRWEKNEHSRSH